MKDDRDHQNHRMFETGSSFSTDSPYQRLWILRGCFDPSVWSESDKVYLARSIIRTWLSSSGTVQTKFVWTKSVQTGEISEWTPNWDHWKHCLSKCKWLIMNFLSSESEPQIRRSARQWNFSSWNSGLLELIISIFITFCQALPDFRLSRFVRLSRFAQAPVWQNRITIWGFEYHEALRDASMMPSR